MKQFFVNHSYNMVKMFLNQFAIGLFGITLALAAKMAKNDILSIVTSVFSIIFYLFLQYIAMWKVGATDRLSADLGKFKKDYSIPVKMWLLSNSLNLFLALLITLRALLPDVAFIYSVGGFANVVKRIIEGMYMGILAIRVDGQPLHLFWFVHFLTTLPALLVIFGAYVLGFNNFKLFKPEGKKSK